jgi:hypothetical protein
MSENPYGNYVRATFADRQRRHDDLAEQKAEVLAERIDLGEEYLDAHPPDIVVPYDRAVTSVEVVAGTADARDEAVALNRGRKAKFDNVALEFPVLGHQFAADGPALALGTGPLLLAPIVRYFGMLPVLFNVFVTRAHQTEFVPESPHCFHLDPEDTTSFKLLVHLTDVDDDCGPFHALPADVTQRVLSAVDYRGVERVEDKVVTDIVGWDDVVRVTGPAGTVAMADTTRCLHFGGRPAAAGKPLREMLVFHYLLPTSLLFATDQPHNFLPQVAPTGDKTWDALIGATLL